MNTLTPTRQTPPQAATEHRWHVVGLCAAALLALAGCATTTQSPEETVRQLATQRWQAVLAEQFDRAYEFTNPAYRKLKTKEQYIAASRAAAVKWTSAEVVRVECEAQKCQVAIQTTSQLRMPSFYKAPLASGLDETWVLEDNRWWKLEKL